MKKLVSRNYFWCVPVICLVSASPAQASDWFAGAHAGWTLLSGPLGSMAKTGSTVRVDVGHTAGPVQAGGLFSMTRVNYPHYEEQADAGSGFFVPGDFSISRFGGIAKWKTTVGDLALTAQGSAGMAGWSSPMDESYYESEVVQETWGGEQSPLGIASRQMFVGSGVSVSQDIADGPSIQLSLLGTYTTIIGLTTDIMIGMNADF